MTYPSFFGVVRDYEPQRTDPKEEAERLLATGRYRPIKLRLRPVRALLLDDISLVPAANLSVMFELLSIVQSDVRPCLWFAFGDFLHLGPIKGKMALTAPCWRTLFANSFIELAGTFRQRDPSVIRAIRDAWVGNCLEAVEQLVQNYWVEGSKYQKNVDILHLMPRHKDVVWHNRECFARLSPATPPKFSTAVESLVLDPDRDMNRKSPRLEDVSIKSRMAALADRVAQPALAHCLQARVMVIVNRKKELGVWHGSIGFIVGYGMHGNPIVSSRTTSCHLASSAAAGACTTWVTHGLSLHAPPCSSRRACCRLLVCWWCACRCRWCWAGRAPSIFLRV